MSSTSSFKYCSLVFYLFLFEHEDRFESLGLNRFSRISAQPRAVFEWTATVREQPEGKGYTKFINEFMSIAYTIMHDKPPA